MCLFREADSEGRHDTRFSALLLTLWCNLFSSYHTLLPSLELGLDTKTDEAIESWLTLPCIHDRTRGNRWQK